MTSNPAFTITAVRTSSDLPTVRALFSAYATSLHIDLAFQSFDSELANLPGAYSPPTGELLLARRRDEVSEATHTPSDTSPPLPEPLGCIALRPLPTVLRVCELKRLYVVPAARRLGVGKALVVEALDVARRLGYSEVCLDTLVDMTAARKLYEELGFEAREAYYDTPIEGTAFLGLRLRQGEAEEVFVEA